MQTISSPSGSFPALLVDRLEAARMLGVSPGTVDNLRIQGSLPSIKLGARRLYEVAELHRLIQSRRSS